MIEEQVNISRFRFRYISLKKLIQIIGMSLLAMEALIIVTKNNRISHSVYPKSVRALEHTRLISIRV